MKRDFRKAAISRMRALFRRSARETQESGVDRVALAAPVKTEIERKDEKGDRHGWLDFLRE